MPERDLIIKHIKLDLIDAFSRCNLHTSLLYEVSNETIEELMDLDEQDRKKMIQSIAEGFKGIRNKRKK